MKKFLILMLDIILYCSLAMFLLGGVIMIFFAYRDSDFELVLYALLPFIAFVIVLKSVRKKYGDENQRGHRS